MGADRGPRGGQGGPEAPGTSKSRRKTPTAGKKETLTVTKRTAGALGPWSQCVYPRLKIYIYARLHKKIVKVFKYRAHTDTHQEEFKISIQP